MKSLFKQKNGLPAKEKHQHFPGPCLNCDTYLDSRQLFCPHCGQKRIEHEDMSFSHLIGESFLDYFHFDSKFFRTIVPLIVRPGFLTREFMKGKRKSYLEPFKLFLVISVIYFLLLPLGGESTLEQVNQENGISVTRGTIKKQPFSYSLEGIPVTQTGQDSIRRQIDSTGIKPFVDKRYAKYGWPVRMFLRQAIKIMIYSSQSFKTTLEHTASKMIFLLIPVFALLLKLVYLKSKRLYFEHLVFSLHVHAFIFLVLTMVLLIEFMTPVRLLYILLLFLLYLFLAMKNNYGERFGKRLWKLLMLSVLYLIVALPVFMILLILVAVFLV
ncbi:MAG: DUF3667 domain-containing protein [Bacteroidota bacterium]